MPDAMRTAWDVIGPTVLIALFAAIIWWSARSVYDDTRRRGLPAVWILVIALLTWPIGPLVYLCFTRLRPLPDFRALRGLDPGAYVRACFVGLFWLAAAFFAFVWIPPIIWLAPCVGGSVTTLSYEERIFDWSWRMPARIAGIALGVLGLAFVLVDLSIWLEYGEFAFGDKTWTELALRQVTCFALWIAGAGLAVALWLRRASDRTPPAGEGEQRRSTASGSQCRAGRYRHLVGV